MPVCVCVVGSRRGGRGGRGACRGVTHESGGVTPVHLLTDLHFGSRCMALCTCTAHSKARPSGLSPRPRPSPLPQRRVIKPPDKLQQAVRPVPPPSF